MVPDSLRRTIPRDSLLARLRDLRPKLCFMIAPAGFGKTTLARAYSETANKGAVCDCFDVAGPVDMARRVVSALAAETPSRADALSLEQLVLPSDDPDAWADLAVRAWSEPIGDSTFTFENAERLVDEPGARAVVSALLARAHDSRAVVICSREPVDLRVGRFAAPHEIVTLRVDDLRFTRAEIERAFSGIALPEETFDAVVRISQGWPIAVFLLLRFSRDGRLAALIADLEAVDFKDLHEYLLNHIIESLAPEVVRLLLACVAIPGATEDDFKIARYLSRDGADWRERFTSIPFVSRTALATFEVHPLVRVALLRRFADRCTPLALEIAQAWRQRGNGLRAAQLYAHLKQFDAAAQCLGEIGAYFVQTPPLEVANVLLDFDRATLLRYPAIWNSATSFRAYAIHPIDWAFEAETVWRRLSPDDPPDLRAGVMSNLVNVYANLGRYTEAEAVLAQSEAWIRPDDPPLGAAMLVTWRTAIAAQRGREVDIDAFVAAAAPVLASDFVNALAHYDVFARIARLRGDRGEERAASARAVELAFHSRMPLAIVLCLADASFGAWLAGEDETFEHYLAMLEDNVVPAVARGVAHFIDCARGRAHVARPGFEKLKARAYAYLIASARAEAIDEARRYALEALTAADQSRQPFVQILTRVALGMVEPERRGDWLREARELAADVDSPRLRSSLASLGEPAGSGEMLAPFVLRFQRRELAPVLQVQIVTGDIVWRGRPVKLAERELEILFFLALQNGPVRRDRLLEAIWPDRDEDRAENTLKVYLSRLRSRFADKDLFVASPTGYHLAPYAVVDLPQFEATLRRARRENDMNDEQRAALVGIDTALRSWTPDAQRWEWFAPAVARIAELARGVGTLLATDAVRHRRFAEAADFVRTMINRDPCDEAARELAITMFLAGDNECAALREFLDYERALMRELGITPSPHLERLVKHIQPRGR